VTPQYSVSTQLFMVSMIRASSSSRSATPFNLWVVAELSSALLLTSSSYRCLVAREDRDRDRRVIKFQQIIDEGLKGSECVSRQPIGRLTFLQGLAASSRAPSSSGIPVAALLTDTFNCNYAWPLPRSNLLPDLHDSIILPPATNIIASGQPCSAPYRPHHHTRDARSL
jgi:hypothetical protein